MDQFPEGAKIVVNMPPIPESEVITNLINMIRDLRIEVERMRRQSIGAYEAGYERGYAAATTTNREVADG